MIKIKDSAQFKKLMEDHQRALDYIKYLESKLDAAIYQEEEFNKKFTKDKDHENKSNQSTR